MTEKTKPLNLGDAFVEAVVELVNKKLPPSFPWGSERKDLEVRAKQLHRESLGLTKHDPPSEEKAEADLARWDKLQKL